MDENSAPSPFYSDEDVNIEYIVEENECSPDIFKYGVTKNEEFIIPHGERKAQYEYVNIEVERVDETNVLCTDESNNEFIPCEEQKVYIPSADESKSTKKRKRNPALWKHNIRKQQRESGQPYISAKNKMVPAKTLKATCEDCCFNCVDEFSSDERIKIFQLFWSLSDNEKNYFYNKFVTRDQVKRRKKNSVSSIKKFSYKYFFEKNQSLHRVCRSFFLNTLSIDQNRIYYYFKNLKSKVTGFPLQRRKGKNDKRPKAKKLLEVGEHTSSFPASNSHCRASSTKINIDPLEYIEEEIVSCPDILKCGVGKNEEFIIPHVEHKMHSSNEYVNRRVEYIDETNVLCPDKLECDDTNNEEIIPHGEHKVQRSVGVEHTDETNVSYEEPKVYSADESKSTKKRKRNPTLWKHNVRKQQRESGQPYITATNKMIPAKTLKASCEDCCFNCVNIFSSNERKKIFQSFWNLSDDEKNYFYNKFVTRDQVKRRKNSESSIKKFSYKYFFEKNQSLHRVCRSFFLNTLSIDQNRIYYYFKNLKSNHTGFPLQRKKGRNIKKVTPANKLSEVREHISSFPATNSHYCKTSSTKKYIDSNLNLHKIYNLYIQKYVNPVSIHVYRKIFNNEFNISFHKPKKNQCDKCVLFQNKQNRLPPEEKCILEEHILEKVALKAHLDEDRSNLDSSTCLIFYDLQHVCNLPKGNASAYYYKQKLNMYNLTATIIMTNVKAFTYCALWTEAHSGRSGNDIASALIKILNELVKTFPNLDTLVLWSDSCVPQNKNKINTTALKMFLKSSKIHTIVQKFSEPGHSIIQELDCVHSAIDVYLKNLEIHSPIHLIKLLKDMPYKKSELIVFEMAPSDFYLYSAVANRLNFNNIPFSEVKLLLYKKTDELSIYFKISARETELQNATIYKSSSKKHLRTPYNIFEHKLKIMPLSTVAMEKKADIKDLLIYLPANDKIYFKNLLKI